MSASLSTSAVTPKVKHSTESILFGFDFMPLLVSGETLTGTPTVSGTPSGLTISASPIVNVATFTNDVGGTVAIGAGVQCRISAGTTLIDYVLTATCATSAGNTRTIVGTLEVRDS